MNDVRRGTTGSTVRDYLGYPSEHLRSVRSEDAVLRSLLERNAAAAPDEVFVTFEDGESWTRRQGWDVACAAAAALREHGVGHGDRVALMLPNGAGFLAAWWGAALLGATTAPINTGFRGAVLDRALAVADPRVVVTDDELSSRLPVTDGSGPVVLAAADLRPGPAGSPPDAEIGLWDDQFMLMTSGTTGASKLVRISYLYTYAAYASIFAGQRFGPDEIYLIDLPLFHMAGAGYVYAALVTGTRLHVRSRPSLDRYWEIVRDHRINGAILISSMVPALLNRAPCVAEREHELKYLMMAPVPTDLPAFQERFGVPTVLTSWGGTEMSAPVLGRAAAGLPSGFCGRRRPAYEIRLVDEHDQDVPVGDIGQGLVRADHPYMMSSGYFRNDAATAQAWRHGWFHTGDLLREDSDGNLYFVDRAGDAIRRRGENVSAYEVELGVGGYPGIEEVAVVAVPADSGAEHEVKAWLVPKPGTEIDFADLLRHCAEVLPHFMVPRYFELVGELPKTPSAKVQKFLLRARGNGASTWDSVQHGLVVTRRGLETVR